MTCRAVSGLKACTSHQAWYATVNAPFGGLRKFKVNYSMIPWATFTDPEIARVGLNEQEAQRKGIAYEVTGYGIDDLGRAMADKEAHVTISSAGYVTAMRHNLGLNKILGTIHVYPTFTEAKLAAGQWKRAHAPERLLRWIERYHTVMRSGK